VPFLWRFHALHHSDPDVDVTTALRHHPIEYILASTCYWLTVITLDIPAIIVLSHGLALFGLAAVQHGNIRLPERLERWLQPVLITTDLHRVHHSVLPIEANSNYGEVLSVWDRLFGTYTRITPERHEGIVFGVRELARHRCLTPSGMFLTPWAISSRACEGGSSRNSGRRLDRKPSDRVARPRLGIELDMRRAERRVCRVGGAVTKSVFRARDARRDATVAAAETDRGRQ